MTDPQDPRSHDELVDLTPDTADAAEAVGGIDYTAQQIAMLKDPSLTDPSLAGLLSPTTSTPTTTTSTTTRTINTSTSRTSRTFLDR